MVSLTETRPRNLVLLFVLITGVTRCLAQEPDWVFSVQLSATVQTAPPEITLAWEPDQFGASSYTIYRKAKTSTSWGSPIATLPGSAQNYSDTAVASGTAYEYQVVKLGSLGYLAYGYIYSGINAPQIDYRGKVVLLVATNSTASLASELARLQSDLVGDGWLVLRHDVSSNDTPAHARSLILADYNADPANVSAVFLFGHVPILQSGFINYDGHGPRPMPADGYYGDMNGDWSSSPNTFPSDVELMVGRVDFADMPGKGAPTPWPNEAEMLRNYLNKNHRWRFAQMPAPRRALLADRFGTLNGETRASTGYRNLEPFVGPGNTFLADVSDTASPGNRWISLLTSGNTWLWTYANGGGQDSSISELGLHGQYNDVWSTDIVAQDPKAVFFMIEGSHLGNWDRQDNIMRAILATPTMGLAVCSIAGHPHYYLHHMGLGEPIGYGIRLTMNDTTLYQDTTNEFSRAVYIALMGDPTLRMEPVPPISGLGGSANNGTVTLNWSGAAGAIGYHVYRSASPQGPFTRLTSSLLATTSYQDTQTAAGNATYMVRAVTLQTNPSGSYLNPSEGVFITVNASGATNSPPTISVIPNQTISENSVSASIPFTVNDTETAAASLIVQGESSNPALVSNSGITFGGNNRNRSVTINPNSGQSGESSITITVSDGMSTAQASFLVTVEPSTNQTSQLLLTAGAYNGLFFEPDQVRPASSGAFSLTLNPQGSYSGRVQWGTRRFPFKGKLDDQLAGTNSLRAGSGAALELSFHMETNDSGPHIVGQVLGDSWAADLYADHAYDTRKVRCAWTGNYTLVLPGSDADASLPSGDGFATVRVSPAGQAIAIGTLADGTSFHQAITLSRSGLWPVYTVLYSGQGSLVGWLVFTNRLDDDLNGMLNWIKPADSHAHFYPAGFEEQVAAVGSVYHRPPGTNHVLDLNTASVVFSGGDFNPGFTNSIILNHSGHVQNQSSNPLTLIFSPATGKFTGKVTDPTGGKPFPFSGVVFQRLNSGFGFLLGPTQSSRVELLP